MNWIHCKIAFPMVHLSPTSYLSGEEHQGYHGRQPSYGYAWKRGTAWVRHMTCDSFKAPDDISNSDILASRCCIYLWTVGWVFLHRHRLFAENMFRQKLNVPSNSSLDGNSVLFPFSPVVHTLTYLDDYWKKEKSAIGKILVRVDTGKPQGSAKLLKH